MRILYSDYYLLLLRYLFLVCIPFELMCISFDEFDDEHLEFDQMVDTLSSYITADEFARAANLTAEDFDDENLDDPRLDPETKHKFFEGDMMVKRKKFKDIMFVPKMWPKASIPYEIEADFTNREREAIALGMLIIHKRTCVRFVPKRWYHINYVRIVKDRGCAAHVGKRGGEQFIILGRGCFSIGTVVHELMHCLGFIHEQSRPDRDDYVHIYWDNIRKDRKREFRRHARDYFYENGFPYDLFSVMHYREYAFSKNGEKTIVAKNGVDLRCNGFECPTSLDIKKINHFYSCDKKKKHGKHYEKYGGKLIKPKKKHKHDNSYSVNNRDHNNDDNDSHYRIEHKTFDPNDEYKEDKPVKQVEYRLNIKHDPSEYDQKYDDLNDIDVQLLDNHKIIDDIRKKIELNEQMFSIGSGNDDDNQYDNYDDNYIKVDDKDLSEFDFDKLTTNIKSLRLPAKQRRNKITDKRKNKNRGKKSKNSIKNKLKKLLLQSIDILSDIRENWDKNISE